MTQTSPDETPVGSRRISPSLIIVLVVLAMFGGVFFAKTMSGSQSAPANADSGATTGTSAQGENASITSVHNDAVADYEAALKTGKPVYLLFHSLTCEPCVEISAVVDRVMPEYEGKIVFVNAISDDPSGQQLAANFQFQYIPTSFFINAEGEVADSFTGAMSEADMKARLDTLAAQ